MIGTGKKIEQKKAAYKMKEGLDVKKVNKKRSSEKIKPQISRDKRKTIWDPSALYF